jgi:hypothetical protein
MGRQNEGKESLSFIDVATGREMIGLSKSWLNFSVNTICVTRVIFFPLARLVEHDL